MQPLFFINASLLLVTAIAYSIPASHNTTVPTVKLDAAVVTGLNVQVESNSAVIEQFLGIPFAQPPYVISSTLLYSPSLEVINNIILLFTALETCAIVSRPHFFSTTRTFPQMNTDHGASKSPTCFPTSLSLAALSTSPRTALASTLSVPLGTRARNCPF